MTTPRDEPLVAVCIATRRRPEGLRQLLRSLAAQSFKQFMVIVVEHDTVSRVDALCQSMSEEHGLRIHHYLQDSGGIPHVRNRAVDAVPPGISWIAFVDDDEEAVVDWLSSLLAQAQASQADIVLGPVLARYDDGVPQWLRAGGFFERKRYRSGERVRYGRTGNALVKRSWFDDHRFDERLSDTGGEDTAFFTAILAKGAKCVWSDEAIVTEFVPADRGTAEWLVKRFFRYGNTVALVERFNGRSRVVRALKALITLSLGAVAYLSGLLTGRTRRLRAKLLIARSLGTLSGLGGHVYRAYRTDGQ